MTDLTLTIIVIALASYEITDLLVYQEGPYNIFERLREYFNTDDVENVGLVGKILGCPYCCQVWVTIIVTIFAIINVNILMPIAAMGLITLWLDYREGR